MKVIQCKVQTVQGTNQFLQVHRVQHVLNTAGYKGAGTVMQQSQILCASWDTLLKAVQMSREGSSVVVGTDDDVKGPLTLSGEDVKAEVL